MTGTIEKPSASQIIEETKEELATLRLHTARRETGLEKVQSADPFPIELLPSALKRAVEANSASLGVPIEFSAIAALAVLSAAAGKGIQVRYRNHLTRPNLFFILGAESGSGKSETLRALTMPLIRYQFHATDRWKSEVLSQLTATEGYLKEEIQGLRKNNRSKHEYIARRSELETELQDVKAKSKNPFILVLEDASEEAFVERLAASNGCTFSYSADAAKPIDNLFGRISNMVDDSHYLKAFSGDPILKERIGRDASSVKDPCATLFWVTTPDRIQPILASDTLMRGGFMARCLTAVIPIDDKEISEELPPAIPFDVQERYNALISEVLNGYRFRPEDSAYSIPCSHDAHQVFIEFHNENVRRKVELKEIRELARRWTELAVRLALVIHLGQYGSEAHLVELGSESAFAGITVVQWFTAKQLEATREAVREREQDRLWRVWDHILRVANKDTKWRVYPAQFFRGYRGCRRICENSREANETLCELVAMDRLNGPFHDDFPKNRSYYFEVRDEWRGRR
jgi:hypothetical protein